VDSTNGGFINHHYCRPSLSRRQSSAPRRRRFTRRVESSADQTSPWWVSLPGNGRRRHSPVGVGTVDDQGQCLPLVVYSSSPLAPHGTVPCPLLPALLMLRLAAAGGGSVSLYRPFRSGWWWIQSCADRDRRDWSGPKMGGMGKEGGGFRSLACFCSGFIRLHPAVWLVGPHINRSSPRLGETFLADGTLCDIDLFECDTW
jgi:hypothetical protein